MERNNANNLFRISCKHCGAPAGFDIPSQSYRCTSCGMVSNTQDAQTAWIIPGGDTALAETVPCEAFCARRVLAHNWLKLRPHP